MKYIIAGLKNGAPGELCKTHDHVLKPGFTRFHTVCTCPTHPRGPCKVFIWEGGVVIRSEHKGSLRGGGGGGGGGDVLMG